MSAEPESLLLDGAIAPAANIVLYGHSEAEEFLARSYASGKGHHALLLEGPEGIGKATLAFRFANHVLSHPLPSEAPLALTRPDVHSLHFRQIVAGASHNLLHLTRPNDAKTGKLKQSITIDEARRTGKFFGQTSGTGNWRIVIVDTADDLNRNAANAILKLLEEPPRQALFLVLSHAPGKLLPTIRSRCLSIPLRPLGDDDLRLALDNLGLGLPIEKVERVLAAAGGSVAQAIKLMNYGGLDVMDALDEVLSVSGPAQRRAIHKLSEAVAAKENDVLFQFFVDQLGEQVAGRARAAAMRSDVERAFRLSKIHGSLVEKLAISDAYNLDRKQTMINLLGELAASL